MQTSSFQWCGGRDHVWRLDRREFLWVGMLGSLGLSLGRCLELETQAAPGTGSKGRAKAVINIFLPGGLSAQESFDPKLQAPAEYRGPLGAVKTRLPGIRFSEHLREVAGIADKITVVRSMTHGEAAHERGTHNMFTGYRPSPAIQYPSLGSVVAHELGPRSELPPYVCIPNQPNVYAGTGYLGSAYGPFSLGGDPASSGFEVRDLTLPGGVGRRRFEERRQIRAAVDAHFSSLERSDALEGMDAFYQRAYAMISSEKARAAFAQEEEPDALRDRYGRNRAGQRMLLSRRLVEAGVRFVSMTYGGWDHHNNIERGINGQLPNLDRALAALILDLEERGLLASTLVLVTTEFGRTPKINGTAGRDHWPRVFNIVMAGAGMQRGLVYGASDPTGGEPGSDPLSVEDFAATVYHQLGIDHEKTLLAPGDRPLKIVKDGRVVNGLLDG